MEVLCKGEYLLKVEAEGNADDAPLTVELAWHPLGTDKPGQSLAQWEIPQVTESTTIKIDEAMLRHQEFVEMVRGTGGTLL